MNYSDKLKTILSITGQKQEDIASEFGVTFAAFSRWLHRKAEPRNSAKEKIDKLLNSLTSSGKEYKIKPTALNLKDEALFLKKEDYTNIVRYILDNPDIKDQFVLSLTYHSNKIEGSTLSESETASVLFHNTALRNKTLTEQLEVKNHQTALEYMFEYIKDGKTINQEFILKIHSILMNSIRSDAGIYRNHGVRITGSFVPTANHLNILKLITELIEKIKKAKKDSSNKRKFVHLCAHLHAEFEQIHPFSDGNGRVGRILLNALLLQENFAPAVILQNKKTAYYKSLQNAQLKEKFEDIEEYIVDAVLLGYRMIERKMR